MNPYLWFTMEMMCFSRQEQKSTPSIVQFRKDLNNHNTS